ncbi:MAG: aspartate--tRNA ligase [Gemmatimonadaceae bacterium]|nr:aspartate--tRNA ligase [Gemmatimonadaceae bacterium]
MQVIPRPGQAGPAPADSGAPRRLPRYNAANYIPRVTKSDAASATARGGVLHSGPAGALATTFRSHLAGSLREADAGQPVRLAGWVHRSRDLGGLVFLDLRDRAGIVQVSFNPEWTSAEAIALATTLGAETVVLIEGMVAARPEAMRNADLATGGVEVRATSLTVVGPADIPAIPVARKAGESLPAEELRLRHRHLDLRRPELQANLVLRHCLMQVTRRHLSDHGFLEIETPVLTKPTPEGARDYLVPSRVHPGEFYALPQSPQLYKQLLMVAGLDRYFQIARCFRDEDLRADRQPEFTQIDIEASFVSRDDVVALAESLIAALWREGGVAMPDAIDRMTWAEAMERFGIDRPDTRFGLEIFDASALFRGATEFGITRGALDGGGRVRGIRVPNGAGMSRKQVDEVEAIAKSAGAMGLLRSRYASGAFDGPAGKHLPADAATRLGAEEGDLFVFVAGPDHVSSPALDRVRQELGRRLGLIADGMTNFLWVMDFPMFDRDPATGALAAVHHPFTAPHPDDLHLLESEPHRVRAQAYDLVLNGTELGGGSIRISNPALQGRIFALLGIDEVTAHNRFGFLLEGLQAGAPPHGGIAFGFDRIAMLLSGAPSLRDVIAFPKTTAARALFEGAPAPVPTADLSDLHLRVEGVTE